MQARLQQERTMERFGMVYDRFRGGGLSVAEAAVALDMSERTFLRKRNPYDEEGLGGLVDGRLDRIAAPRGRPGRPDKGLALTGQLGLLETHALEPVVTCCGNGC